MKKKYYSNLVLSFVFLTSLGFLQKAEASPIDSLDAVVTPLSCFGSGNGQIDITVFGGTSPYTYYWNDGNILEDRINLVQGNYSVTVTDHDGHTLSGTYQVNQPNPLLLETIVIPVSCYGGNNGFVNLTVIGGTFPYTYIWSNGSTNEDQFNLLSGVYQVTVTDYFGCELSGDILVTQPSATFQIVTNPYPVSCFGGDNGAITLNINGGTSPYTFLWNDGSTSESRNSLIAGTYYVSVTDATGLCSAAHAIITQPTAVIVNSEITQINCFGTSSGTVNLTVSGGTPPYSYEWSNGATSEDLIGAPAGTYTVIISDNAGCVQQSGPFMLINPLPLELTYLHGNIDCNGGQNGFINISVNGGTTPYTYLWSNGANSEDLSGIPAGNYTVTVTDANGCHFIQQVAVNQPDAIDPHGVATSITCWGLNNGHINQAPTGGVPPYAYIWSNGAITKDINNLHAGNYTVTITDSHTCTKTQTYTIIEPAFLWYGGTINNVTCPGGSNGEIGIAVIGGTSPYTYLWNDGFTVRDRFNLLGGVYSLTVTDANLCTYSTNLTVLEPDSFSYNAVISNVSCFAGNNGSINLNVTGGVAPYTYLWSNGAITDDISNLTADTYTLTISDANACTHNKTYTISEPALLVLSGTPINNICPGGNTGAINILVAGGTLPYSYLWSDNSTLGNRSHLVAGTYGLTVTDANGCTATQSFTVTQPNTFVYNETITNLSCHGAGDGSITINMAGGNPPYTILWSTGSTDTHINNLSAGNYTVSVHDMLGCETNTQFTVTEPDELTSAILENNVSCFGLGNGSINLTVSGGTSPYSFIWDNGDNTEDITGLVPGTYSVTITDAHNCTTTGSTSITEPLVLDAGGVTVDNLCFGAQNGSISLNVIGGTSPYSYLWNDNSTDQNRTGLSSGNYAVTITDDNGCEKLMNFIINEPTQITSVETISNVSCNGLSDGSISIVVSGGFPTYTYLWSTGANIDNIQSMTAGTYTVTVTDNNNCPIAFTYNITEPATLDLTGVAENIDCNGNHNGTITLTVTGGTDPYSYLWDTGETYADRTNLAPGTYTVTITDANNCTDVETFTIIEPLIINISGFVTDVSCYNAGNGSIDVSVDGGTIEYSYLWSTGAISQDLDNLIPNTYGLTVTDANGCSSTASYTISQPSETILLSTSQENISCKSANNGAIDLSITGGTIDYTFLWSNDATTEDLADLVPGTYTVTVTDAALLCSVISATITEPDTISISANLLNPTCFGYANGEIDITVTGGTLPYSYEWTGGASSEDLLSVSAGTYFVTITDNNNCVFVASYELIEPTAIEIQSTVTNITCNGDNDGSIAIITSGGTPDYIWNWSNGETTESISALQPDTYYLTITDAEGCTLTTQFDITQPDALLLTTDLIVAVTCHNGDDGSIDLTTNGGTPGFTYLWNDGIETEDRTNLTAGTYSLTVTDAHNCTFINNYVISEKFTIKITAVIQDVSCLNGSNGSIILTVSGGNEPYTYLWNDNNTDQDRFNLLPGDYSVLVTDNNGCTQSATFTVLQIGEIIIDGFVTNISCFGFENGAIDINVTGGMGPYTYLWSNGSTNSHIEGLALGTYYVTVTDFNGCTAVDSFIITQPDAVTGIISPSSQILYCSGNAINPIMFIADNYLSPTINYIWMRNKLSEVSGIPANGTGIISGNLYNNTIIDQHVVFTIYVEVNGCFSGTYLADVYVAASLHINFTHPNILCAGGTVPVTIHGIGGVPPYTGEQTVTLGAGTYNYTISDYYGCSVTESITLTEPPVIQISGVVNPAYCSNQNNGGINVSVIGGIGSLNYLWSDGNTNEDRTGLLPGFYTVTVSDGNSCSATHTFNIGALYSAPLGFMAGSPVGCLGQANPIYIYLSGTAPWNFSYRIGTNTYTVNNVNTITYTLFATITQPTSFELLWVTDAHCTGTVTSQPFIMDVMPAPTVSMTAPASICKGQTSNITLNFTGTPPYTVTWFDGTPHTVANITTSTYTIVSTPQITTQYSIQSFSDVYCSASVTCPPVYQIVYPLSTALITGNPEVCSGNSAAVQIHLTGNPPWTVVYNDGTAYQTISNITNPTYNLLVSPAVTTYYTLISVNDFHCSGIVSGQASVLVHQRPTASWSGPDSACYNSDVALMLNLTGTPPWNLTWNDGVSHFVQGLMHTPYIINSHMNINKTFSVTQLSDAFCQSNNPSQLGQPKSVSVHQLPIGIISGPTVSCFGVGTDLEVNLTGTAPWSVNWFNGEVITTISNITESPYLIHVNPSGTTTYFLTAVQDAFCNGQVQGSPVSLTVVPAPIMVIGGLGETNSICEGTQLTLVANFLDGISPFTVNYIDGNGDFQTITNLENGSEITFSPPPFPGNYMFNILSVSSNNGCEVPLNQLFTISVIPAPNVNAGNDTTVTLGNSFALSGVINGGIPPYTVLWTPADYLNDPSSLTPICTPLNNITYTLHVTDSIGCEVIDEVTINIDLSRNIFGIITYDNSLSTPMNDVIVKVLNSQNVVIDSTVTDATGYYAFSNLPDGNYHIKCTTTKAYGGVNATDALLILKHFVHLQLLTGLKVGACDIDGSGFINAIDALSVSKRFTGQVTSFPIGDWYFQPTSFTIPTSVAQFNLKVLCSGDANGSYIPPAKLSTSLFISDLGALTAKNDQEVIIPVKIDRPLEIGAISLVLHYPSQLLNISSVSLSDGNALNYIINEGELRISWYNLEPLGLGAMDELLQIKAILHTDALSNELPFSLGNESEFADGQAMPITEAGLLFPRISSVGNASFDLSLNYPNPFSQQTTIAYTLPSDGKVMITVFDALGREISKVLNEDQSGGQHSFVFDGSKLPEGIYLYRLDFTNGISEKTLMRKMTLLR